MGQENEKSSDRGVIPARAGVENSLDMTGWREREKKGRYQMEKPQVCTITAKGGQKGGEY